MPKRVARLLVVALLCLTVAVLASPVSASAQQQPPATTSPVAPEGPTLNQQSESDVSNSRQKLVIGVTAAILLGIVIYGNRVRWKRRKKG